MLHRPFRRFALATLPLLALGLAACSTASRVDLPDGWSRYGGTGPHEGTEVAVGAVADRPDRPMIVEGTITEVCRTMGCWFRVLDDNGDELFVHTRGHRWFIPRDAAGRKVILHGTARVQTISVEMLRHYAEDAGKTAEEAALITEPEIRTVFYADAVSIEGTDLSEPAPSR